MKITDTSLPHPFWIDEIQNQTLLINETQYTLPIAIQENTIETVCDASPLDVSEATFQTALLGQPELIIIGTGKERIALPIRIELYLNQNGLAVDTMNTQAACRTHNLLLSEGRHVWTWLW